MQTERTLQGPTNKFSNDLSDLDFSLSVITGKLCTRKPLARPSEALASGLGICQPLHWLVDQSARGFNFNSLDLVANFELRLDN